MAVSQNVAKSGTEWPDETCDVLLTPDEAATRAGVSLEKMDSWVRSGEIRCVPKHRYKVSLTELLSFIQRNQNRG